MGEEAVKASAQPEPALLDMQAISKRFPGVIALRNVSLHVRAGEVHGLVGQNGAGTSTLIKILAGAYEADAGDILVEGERIEHPTPLDMIRQGIAVIYQELMLAPHLTVAENLFLGELPRGRMGLIDWREARRKSFSLMQRLGFDVDPNARLDRLSVAQRQMVGIAGAFSRNARIVILDEPSAMLGRNELEKLFDIMNRLKREGVSFIYISHRLQEVFAICDRVTVLRDGALIGTRAISQVDTATLISMMVGRSLAEIYPERKGKPGAVVLRVIKCRSLGATIRRATMLRTLGLIWVLILMCAAAALISDAFLNPFNLINVLRQVALFGIVSVGMTFVILTAGIDLSIGSIVAVTAGTVAMMLDGGTPIPVVLTAGLAIGAVIGGCNGLGIVLGRIPPFIMTLGMMVMGRGLAMTISDSHPIHFREEAADFAFLGQGHLLGLPVPVWLFAAVAAAAIFVLRLTAFGRNVYATGSNLEAARLAGINVGLTIFLVYVISGVLSALTALIYVSRPSGKRLRLLRKQFK